MKGGMIGLFLPGFKECEANGELPFAMI